MVAGIRVLGAGATKPYFHCQDSYTLKLLKMYEELAGTDQEVMEVMKGVLKTTTKRDIIISMLLQITVCCHSFS